MNFYRYETMQYASMGMDGDYIRPKFPDPKLELRTFDLIGETPKGYWIGYTGRNSKFKWISKTSKKRYAYPTKEEAINAYIKRTTRRIEIMEYQISSSMIGLSLANSEKEKIQTKLNVPIS